ncbi:MAG: DUF3501 family protein [Proteobacteria bacterium]|nr:DUF3501 family protein [Pseudomonadota bacterium]
MSNLLLSSRANFTKHDVLTLAQYSLLRPAIFEQMMAIKRRRRIAVGQDATVVFENRAIVWFHLHERLRADKVTDSERRAAIMAEHRALLPAPGELRASLLIDGDDLDRGAALAKQLAGPFSPVSLRIGGTRVRGDVLDPMPNAVHYLRFDVRAAVHEIFDPNCQFTLCLAYGTMATRIGLSPQTRRELICDLGLNVHHPEQSQLDWHYGRTLERPM